MSAKDKSTQAARGVRRIPAQSFLYDRLVPIALIGMGVLMIVIVVIAFSILFGIIHL